MNTDSNIENLQLPCLISDKVRNLMELTGGKKSGILIYEERVIVCDWSEIKGLPFVTFAYDFVFTESDDIELTEIRYVDDVRTVLPGIVEYDTDGIILVEKNMDVLHDQMGDIPALFGYGVKNGTQPRFDENGCVLPVPAVCYYLLGGDEVIIAAAPDDWE